MTENWRPYPNDPRYQVSDHGRVRGIKGQPLKPIPTKQGYLQVSFAGLGTALIHRVVLETFVGPCPEGMECCHWDDVRTNNRLSNLRWGTSGDNNLDMVRNGTHHNTAKATCKRGHLLEDPNLVPNRARGSRTCRACHKAGTRISHRKRRGVGTPDRQALADIYYERIMSDVVG